MTKLSCAVHAAFIPMLFNDAVWILKAGKSHLINNDHENQNDCMFHARCQPAGRLRL
jgi:hypothetical protein